LTAKNVGGFTIVSNMNFVFVNVAGEKCYFSHIFFKNAKTLAEEYWPPVFSG